MIRLDPQRLRRRTKALAILAACHWPTYVARCERQGHPASTAPADLAHHEIATEQTVELLNGEVPT